MRIRHAVARQSSVLPSVSVAVSNWTRRPSRSMRAETSTGRSGTGRKISTVVRTTAIGASVGSASITAPRSAAGGPPCMAPRSHGPRACSLGT